jgi:hypothetical protein
VEEATQGELDAEIRRRNRSLCEVIRSGGVEDAAGVSAHVRRVALAKLAVANPAYRSLRESLTPSG